MKKTQVAYHRGGGNTPASPGQAYLVMPVCTDPGNVATANKIVEDTNTPGRSRGKSFLTLRRVIVLEACLGPSPHIAVDR